MRTLGLGFRVTLFLVIGTLSLGYLFTHLGEADVRGNWGTYAIRATFTNASGLKPGSVVEIAGVPVGQVTAITLNGTRSDVTFRLRGDMHVQQDAIASIQTKGLLGDRYVVITPGASDHIIKPGGKLRETESPLDLPGLLSAYVNSRQKKATPPDSAPVPQN
jgi:phospholipid/cholesterol/gamma-HCH transport system substrate-binding protein